VDGCYDRPSDLRAEGNTTCASQKASPVRDDAGSGPSRTSHSELSSLTNSMSVATNVFFLLVL